MLQQADIMATEQDNEYILILKKLISELHKVKCMLLLFLKFV